MRIAVIYDSSVNIEYIKNFKDTFLVPLNITTADNGVLSDDGSINEEDFYEMLKNGNLKTSQSIVGDVINTWEKVLKDYDHVICVLLSKGLSGQFNTACALSNEDEFNGKVTVIDTNGVSVVNTRIIEKVCKLIEEGKQPSEIKEFIESRTQLSEEQKFGFIIPKALDQLVRGGRITKSAALLAKIAKIVPILRYDGTIGKETKVRLFKKSIEYCAEYFNKNNIKTIDISYSRTDEKTIERVKSIVLEAGLKIGLFQKLPYTIITHTGESTFALISAEIFE